MSGGVEKAIHHGREVARVVGWVDDSTPRVAPRESFPRARRIRESRRSLRAEFIGPFKMESLGISQKGSGGRLKAV
jgi:hypothetical protein